MKRRGGYSDGVMKFLMHGYERPGLDPAAMDGLVKRLEGRASELYPARSGTPAPGTALRFRRAAVRAAAMAAAVVVFVTLGLYAFSSSTAGTPWTLDGTAAAQVGLKAGKAVVKADGGARRVLSTANETVTLEAGAVLEVSGTFMHALTGDDANVYTLKSGSVIVDHGRGSFRLVTPWASIAPIGTAVRASVSGGSVRVACDGGAIELRPLDGSRAYTLHAGEAMAATQVGGAWVVSADDGYAALGSSTIASSEAAMPASSQAPPAISEMLGSSVALSASAQPAGAAQRAVSSAGVSAQAGRFELLWSADTGTQAAAITGIAFGSDTIYLYRTAADGDSILKLRQGDGRVIGQASLGGPYEKHAFDGDRVFLVSGATLSAMDIASGAALWRSTLGPMGFAELAVDSGRVYLPSADGTLYVVDAETGRSLRSLAVGSGLYGKPLVSGGRVVFSSIGKDLRSVDERSLTVGWKASVPGGLLGDAPIAIGELVVTADAAGNLAAFGKDDGKLAWSIRTGQAGTATAFGVSGGALFMLDGRPAVARADGSTITIAGLPGDILMADRLGTVITSGGLYRLTWRGNAVDIAAGTVAGSRAALVRGAIAGEHAIALTADGRLESWRWADGR